MLGPLEVRAGSGELLEVGGARLRALLIMDLARLDGQPDEPGRRLVQVEHPRPADKTGGQVQAPAHAAGVRLHRPVGGVLEPERGQQVPRPAPGRCP
jgi:hypothetical protein